MSDMVSEDRLQPQLPVLVPPDFARLPRARLEAMRSAGAEVLECLHVTGQDSFLLRVATRDLRHLESFVGNINHYGETRTSIIMSAPIPLRALMPVEGK